MRHLHRLRENNSLFVRNNDPINIDKFWAGFQHCAAEISQFLSNYDRHISAELLQHISSFMPNMAALGGVNKTTSGSSVSSVAAAANYQRLLNAAAATVAATQKQAAAAADETAAINSTAIPNILMNRIQQTNQKNSNNGLQAKYQRLHPYAARLELERVAATADAASVMDADGVWRPW